MLWQGFRKPGLLIKKFCFHSFELYPTPAVHVLRTIFEWNLYWLPVLGFWRNKIFDTWISFLLPSFHRRQATVLILFELLQYSFRKHFSLWRLYSQNNINFYSSQLTMRDCFRLILYKYACSRYNFRFAKFRIFSQIMCL